jgi:hypothetical protein
MERLVRYPYETIRRSLPHAPRKESMIASRRGATPNFRVDIGVSVGYLADSGAFLTWREFEVPTSSRTRAESRTDESHSALRSHLNGIVLLCCV